MVIADLRKRGAARPRRIPTLRNTINAAFQMSLPAAQVDALLAALQSKGYVVIDNAKVTYALPAPGA